MRKNVKGALKPVSTAVLMSGIVVALGAVGVGCLDRDVAKQEPNLNTNFQTSVQQQSVDKLDVLFMIDNSASMGDKQQYLNAAVPDLITRLVQPNCIKADGTTIDGKSSADGMGTCPTGDTVEFPPVHNMHLGVVSSALGPRGGDECAVAMPDTAHEDDRGELINRGGTAQTAVPDMTASNYLSWFPSVTANNGKDPGLTPSITSATTLESDFSDLIAGIGQTGCGIESQLESWYRFLIQPDPYDSIAVTNGAAAWVNVDTTILKQRHDFLRPDSLVAIIDLTDENDSEIDVRSLGQQGYNWMISTFQPPRGTMECLTNPGDMGCTSCAINSSDPNCANGNYTAQNDWAFNINLRHVHMKAKYGLDLQFPMSRYVNGLKGTTVPDRDGEYPTNGSGQVATNYVGNNDCTNPLYAATLPDGSQVDKASLCMLPQGSRATDLVFYAHIGGVPWQLLHFTANDSKASELQTSDWVKILGNDPENYDYTGIDPHMIESYAPRTGLPDPTMADNADVENGREWITDTNPAQNGNFVDREFACTFPLTMTRNCTTPANSASCDCPTSGTDPTTNPWDHKYAPPVCGGAGSLNTAVPQSTQIAAKAYPTIREIELSNLMGSQGILSSICPIHVTDNSTMDDPLYGYRPAVAVIVDRLKAALSNQCLPEKLTPSSDGSIPCLILEALPSPTDTCMQYGFTDLADGQSKSQFIAEIQASESSTIIGMKGKDIALNAICEVPSLTQAQNPTDFTAASDGSESCKAAGAPGWCYVTGASAGTCPQAIVFTATGTVPGAQVSLQCIESATSTTTDGGGGGG